MPEFPLWQWKQDVLEAAGDRFERRLSEELGIFRAEVAREFAAVRTEFARAMAEMESRLIRWMFIFWIGQLGATLAVVTLFLRSP